MSTSPTLDVSVSDPNGGNLTVTFFGRVASTPDPDFTIIALPDTQYYSSTLNGGTPAMFNTQTQWVVNNRVAMNIPYVAHLGDIVQTGNKDGNDVEWIVADGAMKKLEDPVATGLPYGIPYGAGPGNHDEGDNLSNLGSASITQSFNKWFGISRFAGRPYYGGHFGTLNDNNYDLFSASGIDFVVIYLAYDEEPTGSRFQSVLAWANGVLQQYPNRLGIVVSHYILNNGNPATFGPQGQVMFNALQNNPNLFLTLSGHIGFPGEGQRIDTVNGHSIISVMSDYQDRANGGNGWLRIMQFSPTNNQISVSTYSPVISQNMTGSSSQFTLLYNFQYTGYRVLGIVSNVASGGHATMNWAALAPGTQYQWYVTVSDGTNTTTGPVWSFTTASTAAPAVSLSSNSLNFGNVQVNTPSAVQNVSLTNTGSATLSITNIGVTGTNSGDYAQTNTCGTSVAATASCNISVTFTPTATGTRTASVTITDNAGGSPHSISLTGNGVTTVAPAVTLSSSSLTFSSQATGTTSSAQTVTLTNTGTGTLNITSIVASGDYAQTNTCGTTVLSGANCTINATFTPTAVGTRTGAITITDNAAGSPHIINLTGTGTAPAIRFIQSASAYSSSATSLSKSFNSATTQNNLIVVGVYTWGGTVLSITDTLANSYLLATSGTTPGGNNLYVYYAINKSSGADTVTVHLSGGGVMSDIHEYAGLSTTTPLDQKKVSVGTGTTINSGSVTTTAPNELIFGYVGVDGNSVSGPGATFTQRENTGNGELSEDKIVSTAGSYSATATCPSTTWAAAIVTFAGASAPPAPVVSLTTTSLTFASQPINTTSAAQNVTLTNTGNATLNTTNIGLTGANTGDYGYTTTCGATLAANAICTISVTFKPTATGTRTAAVSITDNATGSPQSVGLTGTGSAAPAPVVSLSAASLTFASQPVNTTSAAQNVTLTNTGNATLNITNIGLTGANTGDYGYTTTCGATVAANAICTISVTFKPTATGTRTASVTITDNATGSPHAVNLNGTGGAPAPIVSLSAPSLTFASQTVNTTSAAQTVTLTNTGNATLTVTSIGLTGANTADYGYTTTCGATVAANGNCTISVTFKPTATGTRTAAVSITDNAAGSPHAVSLTGTGTTAAAIKFIQSASTSSSSATSLSTSFSAATTQNNLIVVGVYTWGGTVSGITDTRANSYTLATSASTPAGNNLYVFYAINKSSGADTVTVKLSGGGVMSDIHEYAGLSTTTPLDQRKVSVGSGTTINSGSVTTTAPNELIFGYVGVDGNSVSGPGATFTQRENTGNGELSEDKIVSTAGSYSATATCPSTTWAAAIVTFKP